MTDVDLSALTAADGGSPALRGYLATPTGSGPWPGVVVVHELFGLDDMTCRHTDRLAAAGYLSLAVDLFSAGGPRRCLISTFRALGAGAGRPFEDLAAGRRWLAGRGDCTGKIGVIGFCLGGAFALASAASGWDAAAPNYGKLPADLDAALQGACPVVASYGGKDRSLKGAAAKLEAGLTRAGVAGDVKEYAAASHQFLNDGPTGPRLMRPIARITGMGPEPASAADAWARIESFFARHLS